MFLFQDPSELSDTDIIENKALAPSSTGIPLAGAVFVGVGGFLLTANATVGLALAALPTYSLLKLLGRQYRAHTFTRRYPGCVAHLIGDDRDMVIWLEAHGKEEVGKQLFLAHRSGEPFTNCAKRTFRALMPEEAVRKFKVEEFLSSPSSPSTPKNDLPQSPGIQTRFGAIDVPAETVRDDIARSLAESLQSSLIVGQPGAGKGLLIAYATRWVKKLHPECQIWAIDPKSDPAESAYWTACDRILNCPIKPFTTEEEMGEIKASIDKFIEAFQEAEAPMKLLIFDEALAVKEKGGKWFKGLMAGFNALCSMGRSSKQYGWLISQSPNSDDFGISGGTRNVYRRVLLIAKKDLGLIANGSTFFKGKPDPEQLEATGRVFFDSITGGWGITPVYPDLVDYSKKSEAVPQPSRREALERSLTIDIPSPQHEELYHSPESPQTDPAIELIESEPNPQKREALLIAYQWAQNRLNDGKEATREAFIERARKERKSDYLKDNRDEIWDELQALIS